MIRLIKLTDVFHIEYGNQLDLNKQNVTNDGINFVNRSSENLGIACKIERVDKILPFEQGLITVTLGGSILAAYIQPEEFYTGQNVKVLKPKKELSYEQKVFYCLCIKKNAYKYSAFGREANKTFNNILIPSIEEIPIWVHDSSEKVKQPTKEPCHHTKVSLNDRQWALFAMEEFFTIKKGRGLIANFDKGQIPLVSSTSLNNGIATFVNKINRKPFSKNLITVSSNGSVGESFYQATPFYATCDVNILVPKFSLNVYIAMFLNTVIEFEKYKFSYGRKWGRIKMLNSKIKLPINKEGYPDWQFIEYYIKHLPYSKNLEEKQKNNYGKPLFLQSSEIERAF